jgi:hypothetical protein
VNAPVVPCFAGRLGNNGRDLGGASNDLPRLHHRPCRCPWFLWFRFKWRAKQRGDQNELDVLEETLEEHERGRHDNREYIKKQVLCIERDHKRTPEVQRLLDRARRAIN